MTPAALNSAVFIAPPVSSDAPAMGTADTGRQNDPRFSQLLDKAPAASNPDAPDTAAPLERGSAADSDQDSEPADAPWPPHGLETLISPAPAPAAAPVTSQLASANLLTPGNPGSANAAPGNTPATLAAADLPAAAASNSLAAGLEPLASAEALPSEDLQTLLLAGNGALPASNTPAPVGDTGSLAAMAAVTATAAASPSPVSETQSALVPTRADMGGEHFDQDVSQGVEYMLEHKLQSARIRISPQHLGMIEVELRLEGDRLHASFNSAQADVRQALNDSLPRLREMLDAHGLQMGQAAVNDSSTRQQGDQSPPQAAAGTTGSDTDADAGSSGKPAPLWRQNSLLDTYA